MWCMFSNNYIEVVIVFIFLIKDRIFVLFIILSKNLIVVEFLYWKKNYISLILFLLNCNFFFYYMEVVWLYYFFKNEINSFFIFFLYRFLD